MVYSKEKGSLFAIFNRATEQIVYDNVIDTGPSICCQIVPGRADLLNSGRPSHTAACGPRFQRSRSRHSPEAEYGKESKCRQDEEDFGEADCGDAKGPSKTAKSAANCRRAHEDCRSGSDRSRKQPLCSDDAKRRENTPDTAHKDLTGEHAERISSCGKANVRCDAERRADAHKPQKSDASTKRHAERHDSEFHQRLDTDHRTTHRWLKV